GDDRGSIAERHGLVESRMRWKSHVRFGRRAGETDLLRGRHRAPVRSHLITTALDKVRREVWQDLRKLPDKDAARRFKGARWALLKNPTDLTDDQAVTLRRLKRRGGDLWRAYALKEALRAVFAGDLSEGEVGQLLDRFCSKASRSGLKAFVTVAQTIRKRRAGILAAVRLGINNAQHEGLNRRVRLIVNRAYGFHSANAALGLIMLTLGPVEHVLPHERVPIVDP
ncbi:MAG TPA: transposase, partial [Acidimicrobiales bacterium]